METQKGKLRLEKPQMTEEITNAIKDLAAGGGKGMKTFYSSWIFLILFEGGLLKKQTKKSFCEKSLIDSTYNSRYLYNFRKTRTAGSFSNIVE